MIDKKAHIIHHCKGGNHFHILSEDEEYASWPFWSVSCGLAAIHRLITFGISNEQYFTLQRNLLEMAVRKKTKSYTPLALLPKEWDVISATHWESFLAGKFHWREMSELFFFTDIQCDFVRNKNARSYDGQQLNVSIAPIKLVDAGIAS